MDEVLMRSAAGDGVMRDRRKTSIPIATRAVRACDRLGGVGEPCGERAVRVDDPIVILTQ
jgi:hypothetical protein